MILFKPFCEELAAPRLRRFFAALGNWRPGCHGFETALISATANGTIMICLDVADIPGNPILTSVNFSMGDDATTNPSPNFHPDEVLQSIPFPRVCLPNRHDIYVVVYHDSCIWKCLSNKFLDGKVFPGGHQR